MTYDPYGENRRREAEIRQREEQRFWDDRLRQIQRAADPTPPVDPGEAATGALTLGVLLLTPLALVLRLLCLGDIRPPWARWRRWTAVAGLVGFVGGHAWSAIRPDVPGDLGWVVGFLSGFVLFFAALPRTFLILGVLIGALGVYVEFIRV